jgi:hypothetical protein
MDEVLISLIVPTRGRPEGMLSFLESVRDHASAPQNIEVVMVVDQDDPESQAITFEGLSLVTVAVPPGSTMGSLNMVGYRASRGKYVMLTNDDVAVRTPGWDDKTLAAFRSFGDEIVLVHVNDMTFGERLCIFPFVSRRFCEFVGGICPEEYFRYRIDDHICDVFSLLALLGHNRVAYLPDVVFEHQNVMINSVGEAAYIPNPQIHAKDTAIFDDMRHSREELAVRLAARIDTLPRSEGDKTRWNILTSCADLVPLRRRAEQDRMAMLTKARVFWLAILVEREIGKLFCTLGFVRVGALLWGRAYSREGLRICLETLEPPIGTRKAPAFRR